MDLLSPYMPGVVTGEVRFGDGRVQRDCMTLHFPPDMALLLRGGIGSRAKKAYGTCTVCGERHSSLAMLNRPLLVLRREIPPGREVFNADGIFLTMTERVAKAIDLSAFPDLRLQPIQVRDEPIEYIPEIGDVVPPPAAPPPDPQAN